MITFNIEIEPEEIATYISSRFLPDYFQNMRLEHVHLEHDSMNWNGTQPLVLTYTSPGRVEDFAMEPDEHAFPLILSIYPTFRSENAKFLEYSAHWTWDERKVYITFCPREIHTEPSGEIFDTEDVYVSISRKEIFLSYEVIREFLMAQFAAVGLPLELDSPITWDVAQGKLIYKSKNKDKMATLNWILTQDATFRGIMRFLGVDRILEQLQKSFLPSVKFSQLSDVSITDEGMRIPLIL